jgi:hypothetical protein
VVTTCLVALAAAIAEIKPTSWQVRSGESAVFFAGRYGWNFFSASVSLVPARLS